MTDEQENEEREKRLRESKRLEDAYFKNGQFIEGGWQSFCHMAMPNEGITTIQYREMRKAFYCGITWFFFQMMERLEPGEDATDPDINLMENVERELREFMDEIARSGGK